VLFGSSHVEVITLKKAVPNSGNLRIKRIDSGSHRSLRPEFIGALGIKGTGPFG